MTKDWVTKNVGPETVGRMRDLLLYWGVVTDARMVTALGVSFSAVRAARAQLGCVSAGNAHVPPGTPGRRPTLWALPKGKR